MAQINKNLEKIVLPTRASSALTKVLIVGDSQSLRTEERWVGQTQKWAVEHVGAFIHGAGNSAVGQSFSANPDTNDWGATITRNSLIQQSDWGDGNTSDHIQHSRQWDVAGTITPNFSSLGAYQWAIGSHTVAIDLDARKNSRTILRDAAGTFARMRIAERRGTTDGAADDFGIGGDPVVFDASGALRILNWPIRDEATFSGSGPSPVGIEIKDSNNNDTNRDLQILGSLIYNSPSGETFPTTGLILTNTARSSWSAYDLINRQSVEARKSLIDVVEGYDLVIFMTGHNAEDSGAYKANMESLIGTWKDAHTDNGYSSPDILCIAPWNADVVHSMDASKASDLLDICTTNDYGYISMWDSYDGLTPDGRATQLDGTVVTDGIELDVGVHPNAAKDAIAFAKDIEWHFQPENWIASQRTINTSLVPQEISSPAHFVNGDTSDTRFVDLNLETTIYEQSVSAPATVTFEEVDSDHEIRYTTNGRNPTSKSTLYTEPLVITRNLTGSDNTIIKSRIYNKLNPNIRSRIKKMELRII